ncbi:MAG: glycosyltransferase [Actinomycetota bacterium]
MSADGSPTGPVSVVIRNRNELGTLEQVFGALAEQSVPHEIVLVDNESTDGSREFAADNGAVVVSIASEDFSYGGSLNVGMAATSHERVVVLSAHSIPVGRRFLEDAVAPMEASRVAAVRLLRADKTAELARWPARTSVHGSDVDEIVAAGPIASGCVFRRSIWEQIPFDESVDSDEDKVWAVSAAAAGYEIAAAPAVYVYARALGVIDSLQRESRSAMGVYRATGHRTKVPAGRSLLAAIKGAVAGGIRPLWRWADSVSIPLRARRPARRGALWKQPDGDVSD